MQFKLLEEQIDFLLSASLRKCGNIHDAEDLTQETLLAAMTCMAGGGEIRDLKAWLITVMNHKWNDHLRLKYRMPTVTIGEGFDMADEHNIIAEIAESDEAEQIRKAVAFLGKLHREVIVRHYMQGESIAQIAAVLGAAEGTVKRRLYDGREKLKKGFDMMENYSPQSYQPIRLQIANSGNNGINREPSSLVENDLLAQNILWAAYEKPLTTEDIAKTIGTPTAYVEPVIDRLLGGELMRAVGNRYYTDFIIFTAEDTEKHIPAQKAFVGAHFDLLWEPIRRGLETLREQAFWQRCTADAKNSLELYFAFNCLDYGLYGIFSEILDADQTFPFRRDGGRWIAFGHVSDGENSCGEVKRYSYSGERAAILRHYGDSVLIRLHVYGADGFPGCCYYHFPENIYLRGSDDPDDITARLLYLVHTGADHAKLGFNTEYLKAIPWLTACKILREESGKTQINIPVLNEAEFNGLCSIMAAAKQEMWDNEPLKREFAAFIRDKKQKIPAHLDSVPLHKQYLYADNAMAFAVIREAMGRGMLYNGKYDEGNQHPCPMFLVIE